MEYALTKWQNSNYQIDIKVGKDELPAYEEKVLKKLQPDFEMQWFRKWHVPLEKIKENANQQYLQMGMYEEIINDGMKQVIEDRSDIKFIGQIYDLWESEDNESNQVIISFKLDYYPEVEENDQQWKEAKMPEMDLEVKQDEIDQTIGNLQRQYASYIDKEEVTEDRVCKIRFDFLDQDGNKIDEGKAFVWKEDMDEHQILKDLLVGKKINDTVEQEYDEEKLPHILHYNKWEQKPTKLNIEVTEIKEVSLPSMDDEWIQNLFQWEVKNYQELEDRIKEVISNQKKEKELVDKTEQYLEKIKSSLNVNIPQTLINEEEKKRMKSLEDRVGGKDALDKYFEKMSEEEKEKTKQDIRDAAKTSLEKFFLFTKVTEEFGIQDQIDWNTPLDPEQKIYDKLTQWTTNQETNTQNAKSWDNQESSEDENTNQDQENK